MSGKTKTGANFALFELQTDGTSKAPSVKSTFRLIDTSGVTIPMWPFSC